MHVTILIVLDALVLSAANNPESLIPKLHTMTEKMVDRMLTNTAFAELVIGMPCLLMCVSALLLDFLEGFCLNLICGRMDLILVIDNEICNVGISCREIMSKKEAKNT